MYMNNAIIKAGRTYSVNREDFKVWLSVFPDPRCKGPREETSLNKGTETNFSLFQGGIKFIMVNSFVIMYSHQWGLWALYGQFAVPLPSRRVSSSLSVKCNFAVLWYAFLSSCSTAWVAGEVSSVLGCSMKGQKMSRNAEISDENARSSLQYIIHSRDSAVMLAGELATPRAKDWETLPLRLGSELLEGALSIHWEGRI